VTNRSLQSGSQRQADLARHRNHGAPALLSKPPTNHDGLPDPPGNAARQRIGPIPPACARSKPARSGRNALDNYR